MADEVRALAGKTAAATADIGNMLAEIRALSQQGLRLHDPAATLQRECKNDLTEVAGGLIPLAKP